MQAKFRQQGHAIDHTPGSAITANSVVIVAAVAYVALSAIAAGVKGALERCGVFGFAKTNAAWSDGDLIFWNPTGNPYTGTIGTGAASNTPVAGCTYLGRAVGAAGASDTYGDVNLNEIIRNRLPVATVAAAGSTQTDAASLIEGFNIVTGPDDGKGVKLPTAVAGMQIWVKVGDGADLKIYPDTGATINALSANGAITVADDVCLVLTAASATQWYTTPLLPS